MQPRCLRAVRVLARIMWGADNRFRKIEYGKRFARDLATPLHRIPAGKHFAPEDDPDAVAGAIHELVNEAGPNRLPQGEHP